MEHVILAHPETNLEVPDHRIWGSNLDMVEHNSILLLAIQF